MTVRVVVSGCAFTLDMSDKARLPVTFWNRGLSTEKGLRFGLQDEDAQSNMLNSLANLVATDVTESSKYNINIQLDD